MKAIIFSHIPNEPAGTPGVVLKARGYDVTQVFPHTTDFSSVDPYEYEVALIMGGPMGAYQADIFPWLNAEFEFAKKRLEKDLPLFGICLGSQIMAKALGSEVYKGRQGLEIGWLPVQVNEAGMKTPMAHLDQSKTMVMHWHGDTYDLPEGATLLASTDQYKTQAYAFGRNAMAVQFHPEVSKDMLDVWILRGDFILIEELGIGTGRFRTQNEQYAKILQTQMSLCFNGWLDIVEGK